MPLLMHGEVTDPDVDVFDREAVFIVERPPEGNAWEAVHDRLTRAAGRATHQGPCSAGSAGRAATSLARRP